MKNSLKILIFSFSLGLASCEDVVQIKLDEGSKLYVIDAFVNNLDTMQVIRVTTSSSYFSNSEAPPVTNAAVVLKDLTDNTSYTFQYTSNGNYIFAPQQDSMAKINHQYELDITINGITYTALATQKRAASIDSIYRLDMTQFPFGGDVRDDEYFFGMVAKDKVDKNTDYYQLKLFRNDTAVFGPTDIHINIDGTGGAVDDAGELDSLDFTAPDSYLYFNKFYKGDVCKVEIHSISRDTYYFFQQAITQVNNGGLFATTPENVKTNIVTPAGAPTKAVGWFNMASVAVKSKKAE